MCRFAVTVVSEDSEVHLQVLAPEAAELRLALFSRLFGNTALVQTHCATRHPRTSMTSKRIANT